MEITNWKNEESRQKIVNKITDTLQRHMPQTGADGMNELKKIALRFEEETYTVAISQQDYLRRISLKILSLESKASGPSNHFHGSSPGNNQRPLDLGVMMSRLQIRNQQQAPGNSLPLTGQPQPQQPMLQQNLQNSISAGGMPTSAGLAPSLSSIPNDLPPMQGMPHNSINISTSQVLPPLLASNQMQLQSRQQQHQQHQQQHQQLLGQQNMQQQQHQHQIHQLLQSKHQQTQQTSSSLLQSQSQQLQQQSQQQQLLSQLQSQTQPLQQQKRLLQQPNPIQQELQRLQTTGGLLQQPSSIEQQKQLLQPCGLPEGSSTSMESSGQTGQPTAADQQEKVYQRLQTLKEMYFPEIKELFTKLQTKCQQPMQPDQSEKLKHYKTTFQRMMAYFQVPKGSIPPGFTEDKVDAFEKQIQAILNSFKQRKSAPQQQQGQQQLPSQVNNQVQEKVYQRLQTLKEMYFPEIKELFTKLQTKCHQSMQPDHSEKLKRYNTTLQRMMAYFQVPKSSIPPGFTEDKVDAFEKQIQAILNSFKQRKSAPQQQQGQQQLPSQVNNQVQEKVYQRGLKKTRLMRLRKRFKPY